jgi:hypothetical protein
MLLLYATENDFGGARGVIGIYDAGAAYRRIGEFSSGGIGPHDLVLMGDEPVLVIANGGLIEHPDFGGGRRILNPERIETVLAYVDLRHGELLERQDLGLAGALSLRHLDVARDRTVIIGAQVVNGPVGAEALVFKHQRQRRPEAVALPLGVAKGLSGYVSSIACDRAGQLVAVTSSKGACAVVLDVASGRVVHTRHLDDVSGISPSAAPEGFLATAGTGRIALLTGREGALDETSATPWMWDNHAVFVADGLS